METTSSTPTKQQIYSLVEQLPDAQADAVLAFVQVLRMDPVSRALRFAPYDEEPITEEEQAEVDRARREPRVRLGVDELLNL